MAATPSTGAHIAAGVGSRLMRPSDAQISESPPTIRSTTKGSTGTVMRGSNQGDIAVPSRYAPTPHAAGAVVPRLPYFERPNNSRIPRIVAVRAGAGLSARGRLKDGPTNFNRP